MPHASWPVPHARRCFFGHRPCPTYGTLYAFVNTVINMSLHMLYTVRRRLPRKVDCPPSGATCPSTQGPGPTTSAARYAKTTDPHPVAGTVCGLLFVDRPWGQKSLSHTLDMHITILRCSMSLQTFPLDTCVGHLRRTPVSDTCVIRTVTLTWLVLVLIGNVLAEACTAIRKDWGGVMVSA